MKSVQRFIVVPALKLRYETSLYDDWCQTVSEKSQYNLSQPLLQRDPEMKQITVNFNPQVSQAAVISFCVLGEFCLTLLISKAKWLFIRTYKSCSKEFAPWISF